MDKQADYKISSINKPKIKFQMINSERFQALNLTNATSPDALERLFIL